MTQAKQPSAEIWPGFHFLRHLLAVVILAFHAYVLTFGGTGNLGYAKGDLLATAAALTPKQLVIEMLRPGLFALVGMFFALSGFLVMMSALRAPDTRSFFTLRALRILPALLTEVVLSAFVLGPCVTTLKPTAYFADGATYSYFGNIVGLVQYELPGVFKANPLPGIVNVNLWTLHAEFCCYLLIGAVLGSGLVARRRLLSELLVAGVALSGIAAMVPALGLPARYEATHFQSWFLVVLFALGMLFALHRHAVALRASWFVASVAGYVAMMVSGACDALAAVLLTYAMVYLGSCRFPLFDRLVKDDCSYGIYLYGYPITQTLVLFFGASLAPLPGPARLAAMASLAVLVTSLFALTSWRLVEKPFLRLRGVLLPKRPAVPAPLPLAAAPAEAA